MNENETGEAKKGLPDAFIAVFMDDNGEVQIGATSTMTQDAAMWVRMLEVAVKKIELAGYQDFLERQNAQGGGLIRPY